MGEARYKKGLSAYLIKLIAILAMTLDHIAWGGIEFYSFGGQALHIIGRLTIPIMSFFIVEGYFHTKNLKNYALRLLMFGVVSAVPFYMFFGEMYSYRQNILIDLLIALAAIAVVDNFRYSKPVKIFALFLLVAISVAIGGWPILPMAYALIFYFNRGNFKKICIWFIGVTILLVVSVTAFSIANNAFSLTNVHWDWYEKLYLLGFVLALPFIKAYNGEKGGGQFASAFFYFYYPIHLLILSFVFKTYGDTRMIFIMLHIAAMALMIILIVMAACEKNSSNTSITVMLSFGLLFMAGYFGELISPTLESIKAVVKIEYLADIGFIISFTWFVSDFLRIKFSPLVYWIEVIIGGLTVISVYFMDYTTLFYRSFTMSYDKDFPIAEVEPGIVYLIFYFGVVLLFIVVEIAIYRKSRQASFIEHKRILIVNHAIISLWFFIALKVAGISKYDLISFAILAALCFVSYGAMKFGFVNSTRSIALNVINHSSEIIIAIDMSGEVLMMNENSRQLFPEMEEGTFIDVYDQISKVINGLETRLVIDNKTYEFKKEPINEQGIVRGYMLWAVDISNHIETITEMLIKADTDGLTGAYNRSHIEKIIREDIEKERPGTLFMMDLDNFKQVNDHYGHNTGDAVLIAYSKHLKKCFESMNHSTVARLGGDEFMVYVQGLVDENEVTDMAESIIVKFQEELVRVDLPTIIGSSVGVCINDKKISDFAKFYKQTDEALYYAKRHGKNDFKLYDGEL